MFKAKLYKYFLICLFLVSCFLIIPLTGCGEEDQSISSIVISPANPAVGINKTLQLFADAYNASGGRITGAAFTWSITGTLATIDNSGKISAGSQIGTVTATASSGAVSKSVQVSIIDTGFVAGRLTSSLGEKIPNITIKISGIPTLSATSDSNGDYTISKIPPGSQTVETSGTLQYISSDKSITISIGETARADITLTDRVLILTETIQSNPLSINGTVTNNGTTVAKNVAITYSFFSDDGSPAGTGVTTVGDINPQEIKNFNVIPILTDVNYSSFQKIAVAESF